MKNNAEQERTCPLCGQLYMERPAISRSDGETLICPDCGVLYDINRIDTFEGYKEDLTLYCSRLARQK